MFKGVDNKLTVIWMLTPGAPPCPALAFVIELSVPPPSGLDKTLPECTSLVRASIGAGAIESRAERSRHYTTIECVGCFTIEAAMAWGEARRAHYMQFGWRNVPDNGS